MIIRAVNHTPAQCKANISHKYQAIMDESEINAEDEKKQMRGQGEKVTSMGDICIYFEVVTHQHPMMTLYMRSILMYKDFFCPRLDFQTRIE